MFAKRLVYFFMLSVCIYNNNALVAESIQLKSHTAGGELIAIEAQSAVVDLSSDPVINSDVFIEKSKAFVFDVTTQLLPAGVERDSLGMSHVRYRQVHHGIPIYGAEVIAHLEPSGAVRTVTGRTLREIDISTTPIVSLKTAKVLVRSYFRKSHPWRGFLRSSRKDVARTCRKKARRQQVKVRRSRCYRRKFRSLRKSIRPVVSAEASPLYIYDESFVSGAYGDDTRLAYRFKVTNRTEQSNEIYFLDASSGELLDREDGVHGANRAVFDCGLPDDTNCWIDLKQNYALSGGGVVTYYHGRSEEASTEPFEGPIPRGQYPSISLYPGVSRFFGSTNVDELYDEVGELNSYYFDRFDRDGANGQGGTGDGGSIPVDESRLFVHADGGAYGSFCPTNGGWSSTTSVTFCLMTEGLDYDLIGHEFAHTIAKNMSLDGTNPVAIVSDGESGALNEAHSDFMGEAYEFFRTGTKDWLVDPPDGSWQRNMSDPVAGYDPVLLGLDSQVDNFPDTYTSADYFCASGDHGGAHVNSSVMNKASFLMVDGGDFSGCTISALGMEKVEQIWYRALNVYFTATETFNMAYNSFQLACADFAANETHGITTADCAEVTKALQAVKMDQDGGCSGTADPAAPATCAVVHDPPPAGDFDVDEDVDAMDYVKWHDIVVGTVAFSLAADANEDGFVDEADCAIWKSNYGACVNGGCSQLDELKGDYDGDLDVDSDDYVVWASSYGTSAVGGPLAADGNKDGIVDGADFLIWQQNVGMGNCDTLSPALNADLDHDMDIDFDDIVALKASYGATGVGLAEDLNGDQVVNSADCQLLKQSYAVGHCPPLGVEGEDCSTSAVTLVPADGNHDGVNDQADYNIWKNNYGSTEGPGDYNKDGKADAADYTVWRNNLGAGSCE